MKSLLAFPLLLSLGIGQRVIAQEASAGIDLRATLTAESIASNELTQEPRSGSPITLASRSVIYPTIKFSDSWSVTGAVQFATRPYSYEQLSTAGYGTNVNILQATLNYSRVSDRGSLVVRAGEMSSAFGSFLLRYDDMSNPLVDIPSGYGYYYAPVSLLPVAGAEIDGSRGKFDGRVQFANSSPANPRSIFSHDQYGNWAGGAGYTVRQGFRIGVSGYRGPYLDRDDISWSATGTRPGKLPAHALGIDGNWSHRQTAVYVELQKSVEPHSLYPNFHESVAYGEVRQALAPRWFIATRYGFLSNNVDGKLHTIETALAYRPGRNELIKISYEEQRYQASDDTPNHTLGIQVVTTLHRSFVSR